MKDFGNEDGMASSYVFFCVARSRILHKNRSEIVRTVRPCDPDIFSFGGHESLHEIEFSYFPSASSRTYDCGKSRQRPSSVPS